VHYGKGSETGPCFEEGMTVYHRKPMINQGQDQTKTKKKKAVTLSTADKNSRTMGTQRFLVTKKQAYEVLTLRK